MAAPAAAVWDVYELGGATIDSGALREQLLDQISNVDPFDNPIVAMLPRETAKGVLDQWLTNTLPTVASLDSGRIEGNTFGASTLASPTRVTNVTMILGADIEVSETTRAVEKAGFKDSYSFQVADFTKALGNKLESMLLDPTVTYAAGDASTARVLKNFNNFLDAAATSNSMAASTAVSDIIEGEFNDALQDLWTNGGVVRTAVVGPNTLRQIQTYVGVAKTVADATDRLAAGNQRNVMADARTLYASIEFYKSPFGMLTILLDRWMPDDDPAGASPGNSRIYFVDRTKASLAWLRPLAHTFLGKVGDSTRGSIVGEVTLRVLNDLSHFMVKGTA